MKELKFNEEMQLAIDEGRKTQTRRVIDIEWDKSNPNIEDGSPYGKIGDVNNGVRITDIRVERLQEISEEDAISEGIEIKKYKDHCVYNNYYTMNNTMNHHDARQSFESLWQSIYANHPKKDWNLNPWVWVIEFEKV